MVNAKKILFAFIFLFGFLTGTIPNEAINLDENIEAIQTYAENSDELMLVPGGNSIGITLNTDGVIVTNLSDIQVQNGDNISPAKESGIKNGDIIQTFNDKKTSTVEELSKAISESNGNIAVITVLRGDKTITMSIDPEYCLSDGQLRIGAWVKDAMSGIGTLTYYNPQNNSFASLGHGICNPETGEIIQINKGEVLSSSIVDVQKGKKGNPGELKGIFSENNSKLGFITGNSKTGIYGTIMDDSFLCHSPLPVADKNEIQKGSAFILANIDGEKVEKYDIEIIKVVTKNSEPAKNMILKITDKNLLEKTGGIVQGMSGSPIIQNDKLVGAVTHVFVNDPTRGYGIFIENMLAEADKIK